MLRWILRLMKRIAAHREPIYIGGRSDPYMIRWHLLPRNPLANVYLHQFLRPDDDRAMHDHPWWSLSLMLDGACVEHDMNGCRAIHPGQIRLRSARYRHRIETVGSPCWTLFITGPRCREWGFWCPWGWRHWKEFTTGKHGEQIGKGCE